MLTQPARRHAILATASLLAARALAQQPAAPPPVRQLGPRLAITTDSLGSVESIRALSNGRVLVNDDAKHQLLMYDATLSHRIVVADSTTSTKKAYGSAGGGLIAYPGDSTLFVDPIAIAMLLIDPDGKIIRAIAPPYAPDVGSLSVTGGSAAFDANGRIVYRQTNQRVMGTDLIGVIRMSKPPSAAQLASLPIFALHDSVVVLRGDMQRRTLDTAGFLAIPLTDFSLVNPIQVFDDWAVLSDGSVAFVRAIDYHIDWINADGTRSSTPRMAHEWHRLTDSERVAISDQARQTSERAIAADLAHQAKLDSEARATGRAPSPHEPSPLFTRYVLPDDLPDYLPVITRYAVTPDADNHLWIRLGATRPAIGAPPPIYDIVNRQGQVIDRVQLPPSLNIAGFGPGIVYMSVREGNRVVLAKYRIK